MYCTDVLHQGPTAYCIAASPDVKVLYPGSFKDYVICERPLIGNLNELQGYTCYPQTNLGRICNEPNEVYVPFLDDTRNAVVK